MPVIETQIQHHEVIPYLCRRVEEGGLGYRETSQNIVSEDLFIPSQLEEFLKISSPMAWKALLNKYHNDSQALLDAICEEIRKRIINTQNVAMFFNNNKNITFEGETLTLFYVSGSEIKGNTDFSRNIFAAVEEVSHNIVCDGITLLRIRPDICFFLNGIFFGYLELKSVTNGQTAREQGRGKVISDYLESVKGMADRERYNAAALDERKSTLYIFEKAIHIVATDVNETYVMRNIASFFDDARRGFLDRTESVSTMRPKMEQMFKIYPISSTLLSERQRFEEVMTALYSKSMVEREILYYNFSQFHYVAGERISHRSVLISPRPKQKFGCDKIIARVKEMLAHEQEPEYYSNILRRQLQELSVTPEKIEEIIKQRNQYCNNKYVYSLLMQYAAGFGKSNIIGWTALQLKDLRYNGNWAYDKIMIVVDRLQLREQLDTMMQSMNIDKSMFVEAKDQPTFVSALKSQKRIIVVNIQKFLELQNALNKSNTTLKQMRVAFLIDEIHRSNTGENNKEMINLFEKLQDSINLSVQQGGGEIKKKNLIIGFTATPSEKVLARFGEFKSASIIPTWVPFDAYTMKEAIADGYILDPTKHIIPVNTKLDFELPKDWEKGKDVALHKETIYRNIFRMEQTAQFVVDRLVSQVYGKIHGQGKAMLAVTSIPIAIQYCTLIRQKMEAKCNMPLYRRYKDAPISIVYSDNQEYESSASMNEGIAEDKVIQNFKAAKNGLIIVVDKLQTGFDEPKLHTLFLDKEISDINAIQTISRVNRTCKYKEDCHIIDLSWKNVNMENIRLAFKKYCGITTSDFNPEKEAQNLEYLYKDLQKSDPYERWFKNYKQLNKDTSFVLQMEDGIRQWIKLEFERTAKNDEMKITDDNYLRVVNHAKELRNKVGQFASSLTLLDGVLDVDPKYSERIFLNFWEIYCRIYLEVAKERKGEGNDILEPDIISDEYPGITVSEEDDEGEGFDGPDEGKAKGSSSSKPNEPGAGKTKEDILKLIKKWNEDEELSAKDAQAWLVEIGQMFENFRHDDKLIAVLDDENFPAEVKMNQFMIAVRRYGRKMTSEGNLVHVEKFKKMINENAEQLLATFLESLPGVQADLFTYNFMDNAKPQLVVEGPAEATIVSEQAYIDSSKEETLYLTIQQKYFDQIIAGTKKVEYRDILPTTYRKYLRCDKDGSVFLNHDVLTEKGFNEAYTLNIANNGVCPFFARNIKFLKLLAGKQSADADRAIVEVTEITFQSYSQGLGYVLWQIEFHLGKVIARDFNSMQK